MIRKWAALLLLAAGLAIAGQTRNEERNKAQKDYVPDEKTAVRIAEAVLVAQYGEAISGRFPLLVDGSNKDFWILQVHGEPGMRGGGPGIWINRHTGCMKVMERMK